jgi:hypothetical protein
MELNTTRRSLLVRKVLLQNPGPISARRSLKERQLLPGYKEFMRIVYLNVLRINSLTAWEGLTNLIRLFKAYIFNPYSD